MSAGTVLLDAAACTAVPAVDGNALGVACVSCLVDAVAATLDGAEAVHSHTRVKTPCTTRAESILQFYYTKQVLLPACYHFW